MEAILEYDERLLRRAAFAFWRRTTGLRTLVAAAISAIALGYLVCAGNRSWVVGMLGTGLAIAFLLMVAVYQVHYRRAIAKFRAMGEPRAMLRADDAGFTLSSSIGTSTLPWSAISEVWQFPGFWLLLFSRSQFSTLPTDNISPEMQELIVSRVAAAGGKIR